MSGTTTNTEGVAVYSLQGDQFTFSEYFNSDFATDLKFLSGVPGFPFNATVTVQPDASGSGLDVIGTGLFSGLSETDLFPDRQFTVTTTADLHFIDTGSDGFELTFTTTVSCFAAGTLIETSSGARPVETIAAGDVVRASGREAPVTWAGSRRILVADVADADMVLPIRIRRDAVAAGQPSRDLVVSPDHAVWIDGRLIPARLLVNGVSVVQERCREIEYFHIALDRHDLLLAEGLPVESYLDVAGALASTAGRVAPLRRLDVGRPPALAAYDSHGFAPLAISAELVRPVWDALADRAGVGPVGSDDMAGRPAGGAPFTVVVEGHAYEPVQVAFDGTATTFRCVLPKAARVVTLASDAASPWSTAPWLDDRRRLGIAVSALSVVCRDGLVGLPLPGPALGSGWHDVEVARVAYRWTDGQAMLALPDDASMLLVSVVGVADLRRIAVAA